MKARFSVLLLAGIMVIVTQAGGQDPAKRDGTWAVVAMEQDGVKLPAGMVKKLSIKLIIMGDKYKVTFADKLAEEGTTKADWTKSPATIDIDASVGPNKGKTIQAIVVVEADTMKVCYNLKGRERPRDFTTKDGSGHTLIVYERQNK